jgi:translation initiation factor 4A
MNDYVANDNTPTRAEIPTFSQWDELSVPTDILRGIYAYGFETPSPIQGKAIMPMVEGHDIVAQAQSGTGKTGAFTIGALSRIDVDASYPQVIILSPTRELSLQINDVVQKIGSFSNIKSQLLVGGSSVDRDMSQLDRLQPHVIVGCSGRVHDMIRRGALKTDKLKTIVVDEADEMLDIGFKDQMQDIFRTLPENIQVALFSATLPEYTLDVVKEFMRAPVHIIVKREALTLEGISQYYVAIENDHQKYETLKDLYSSFNVSQCIIYCNSVERVKKLYDAMNNDDYPVCCIHGDMDRKSREKSISDFRTGTNRVLISSNVTARGIDVQQVSVVINFDICKNVHTYLHRIGRSGRWGRKGVGINFVTRRDIHRLRDIEQYYSTQVVELPTNFMQTIV